MALIYNSGNFTAFAFRLLLCCLVVAVGPICRPTAAEPTVENVTQLFQFGDSPVWIESKQSVYFIDRTLKTINRYQTDTKSTYSVTIKASADLKFLVPSSTDPTKFAVGFDNGVGVFSWDGISAHTLSQENFLSIAKDPGEVVECGKGDVSGFLFVGTSYPDNINNTEDRTGRLYSVNATGFIHKKFDNIGVPGGIAWSMDDGLVFYSDTSKKIIVRVTYNKDFGYLYHDGFMLFNFADDKIKCVPGGMTIDTNGNLWVACWESSYIVIIDPKERKLLTTVIFPETYSTTSAVFGGKTFQDLFVTTAAYTASASRDFSKSGSLFRVTNTGSRGIGTKGINIDWPKG